MLRSNPLLRLAAGRAAFGAVAVGAAVPLCRLAEITSEPGSARRVGLLVAAIDGASVAGALSASSTRALRRVCVLNAATDLAMASTLLGLATRRRGSARFVNAVAAFSVLGGAVAWAVQERRLGT
jgi:hypothetical protein